MFPHIVIGYVVLCLNAIFNIPIKFKKDNRKPSFQIEIYM